MATVFAQLPPPQPPPRPGAPPPGPVQGLAASPPPPPPPATVVTAPRPSIPPITAPPPTAPAPIPVTVAGTPAVVPVQPVKHSSSDGALIAAAVGVALVIAALAVLALRRPRRAVAPPAPPTPPVRPSATTGRMQRLLDVSRRLTDTAATGDVDRAVVREAVGLVGGDGAALVTRTNGDLAVAMETEPGLLVADALGAGAIGQVADTGQPLLQVSGSEPAIRHLPVAMAAVPLVNGGRVDAVLVVVRRPAEPFSGGERDALMALAPVAAAAMQTARQTRAAVEESLVDPLTGVGNRRRFDAELDGWLVAKEGVGLCIVDVDHFKRVNDTYGHPAGDAVLKGVAAAMQRAVRPGDSVYRIGGEEFAVVLRRVTADAAAAIAERVRINIAAETYAVGGAEPLRATASIGLALATDDETVELLTARADAALYAAKQGGRNRVRVAAPEADVAARSS